MTRLDWDQPGSKGYETGLDRGVLYVTDTIAIPWSGLTAVDEDTSEITSTPLYFDGNKYIDLRTVGDYKATIKAFTYPDEFLEFDGLMAVGNGMFLDNQPVANTFGLSYRTLVGNDIDGLDHGYKIHLLYNLTATPNNKSNPTLNNAPQPNEFSWSVTGVPEPSWYNTPTVHIVFHTTRLHPGLVADLEEVLYGGPGGDGRLPTIIELQEIVEMWRTPIGPVWATGVKAFHRMTGAYNFNETTMARFKTAKQLLINGNASLHISVIGDSISAKADYVSPQGVTSWSAIMKQYLMDHYGWTSLGSGLLPMQEDYWVDDTPSNPAWEPRLHYKVGGGGSLQHDHEYNLGIFGRNLAQIFTDSGNLTELQFTPGTMTDEFWVYLVGNGYRSRVWLEDGSANHKYELSAYFGEPDWSPSPTWVAHGLESGFIRHDDPAAGGGLRVARIIVPAQNNWNLHVQSYTPTDGTMLLAVENRWEGMGGIRVSNLAEGGRDLYGLMAANSPVQGVGGMEFAINAPRSDLCIIGIGINDFQGHRDVATYKAQLKTLVNSQRSSAYAGQYGHGLPVEGDVLLWIPPLPNFAAIPTDGVQIPPIEDFWRAVHEVADEDDVALIDHGYRWGDYKDSSRRKWFSDNIHPNAAGHYDIGITMGRFLAQI